MEVIIVNDNFFVIVIIVTKIDVRIICNNSIQPVTGWYLLVTAQCVHRKFWVFCLFILFCFLLLNFTERHLLDCGSSLFLKHKKYNSQKV